MIGQIVKETDEIPILYYVLVRDVSKDGWWREVGIYQEVGLVEEFVMQANGRGHDARVITYDPDTTVTSTQYPAGQDPVLRLVVSNDDG